MTDRQYDRTDERRDDRQDNRQDDRQDDRWDDRRDDRWDDRQEWREERWEDLRRAYWRNQVIRHLWTLPVHKVVVVHNHRDYHYVDGEFFLFTDGRYVLVDPPAGVVIASLPTGYETLMVYGVAHYYFGGVYYAAHNHGFVVVHL